MVVADLDMDGNSDVILLHGGWNAAGVYRQTSPGTLLAEQLLTLPYASSYNRQGLAVGDINGDGRPDVVVADYNNGLVVLYNATTPPPVRISRISMKPGGQIVLKSPYCGPHGSAVVQRSTTLTSWTPVGTISDSLWSDTNSSSSPQAFYRLAPQWLQVGFQAEADELNFAAGCILGEIRRLKQRVARPRVEDGGQHHFIFQRRPGGRGDRFQRLQWIGNDAATNDNLIGCAHKILAGIYSLSGLGNYLRAEEHAWLVGQRNGAVQIRSGRIIKANLLPSDQIG